ncbi:MAG TPA: homoserine kinase [Bacillales bacterium]|nr:homoserine kinase [Bacillales bacterium]
MTADRVLSICVPGSTSNLGAGFDSIGLAVNRYLRLEAVEDANWQFDLASPQLEGLPTDENNLIAKTVRHVAAEAGAAAPACRVRMTCELPTARGLGSSAAAIVAGIELADRLLNLELSPEDRLKTACLLENHADNLAASLFGGLVITAKDGSDTYHFQAGTPGIEMVVLVPVFQLKTVAAREVLPQDLPFQSAVAGSSFANLMVAAIMKNDWATAGRMMEKDLFHQPYRESLVPGLKQVAKAARGAGAYGAALSGAGPAMIAFVEPGKGDQVAKRMRAASPAAEVIVLRPDGRGAKSEWRTKVEENVWS